MSVAGIGSTLSSLGSQYDFTKLTNAQLLAAAQKLRSEGKISQDDAREISFVAQGVDWAPAPGTVGPTVAQTLADPTQKDWLAYFKQSASWADSVAGTVGGAVTNSVLKDLQMYQDTTTADTNPTLSKTA